MTMADCPCCLPPWAYTLGTARQYLYVSQSGNGVPGNSLRIRKFDLAGNQIDGSFWTFTPPTSLGAFGGFTCDQAGNLYIVLNGISGGNTLRAIDSAAASLWNVSFGSHDLQAVAVNNTAQVYAGYLALHKFDAATGAEDLSGGWPFTPSGAVFIIQGICVDQVGNSYFCGGRSGGVAGDQVFAMDATGSVIWSMTPSLMGDTTPPNQSCTAIAISADGTQLCVTRSGNSSSGVEYIIDAATGSQVSGLATGDVDGLDCCEWDRSGNYYTGTQNRVRKNGSILASLNPSRPMFVNGLAVGSGDDQVFAAVGASTGTGDAYRAASFDTTSGAKNWSFDDSGVVYGTSNARFIAYSRGRVGAFG